MSGFELVRRAFKDNLGPSGGAVAVKQRHWGSSDRFGVSFVIDCSSSMAGSPMKLVNDEMAEGFCFLQKDVIASQKADIQVIAAGGFARSIVDFMPPRLAQIPKFVASGDTPLYEGALMGAQGIVKHECDCQAAGVNRIAGILIILTDGAPTDGGNRDAARKAIASIASKCCVFPIVTPAGNAAAMEDLCGTKAVEAGQGELSGLFRKIFNAVSVVSSMQPSQISVGTIRGLITNG